MAARATLRSGFLHRILNGVCSPKNRASCGIIPCRINTCPFLIKSAVPYWNKLSSSLASSEVESSSTNIRNIDIQSINIAVCVERVPLITRDKTELEKQYEELQERLEYEHSSLSDHEVFKAQVMKKREQLKHDEDNEELKKEVALLDSEYQELKEIEEQHIKEKIIASRTTEADLANDKQSPNRKLESKLFLLTQNQQNPQNWQLPQGSVNPGETLREAAERIIKEYFNAEIAVRFMSNAPSGVYRRAEKDGAEPGSPKVFFYQAQLLGAAHKYCNQIWSNCIWASKDELVDYLPSNYHRSILKFLL